jgi:hypothetical protein
VTDDNPAKTTLTTRPRHEARLWAVGADSRHRIERSESESKARALGHRSQPDRPTADLGRERGHVAVVNHEANTLATEPGAADAQVKTQQVRQLGGLKYWEDSVAVRRSGRSD